jgi:hypothetical protein
MSIEGFRSLNSEISTIINKSEAVKKAKREGGEALTPKEKQELTKEEKEYKSMRKKIQEKLIKFATRVPIFMYLTDYREHTLEDVIKQLEPELFKTVTGLTVQDFDLLCSLGVFNKSLMNDAIYKFRRYEDSSLSYTGINKHKGEGIGLFDTVLSYQDYMSTLQSQQKASLIAADQREDDIPDQPFAMPVDDEDDGEEETIILTAPKAKPIDPVHIPPIPIIRPRQIQTISNTPSSTKIVLPNKQPRPDVDYSNITVGMMLRHKAFGEGEVVKLVPGYIEMLFGKVKRTFQFPSSIIDGFLSPI